MDKTAGVTDPHQYEPLKGSSTTHARVALAHEWQQALDTPEPTIRVLLIDKRPSDRMAVLRVRAWATPFLSPSLPW